jgi:hypothetical protein
MTEEAERLEAALETLSPAHREIIGCFAEGSLDDRIGRYGSCVGGRMRESAAL